MARYNIYDSNAVNQAANNYNRIASSSPVYRDSAATTGALKQANAYEKSYNDSVKSGYRSAYGATIARLANDYQNNKFEYDLNGDETYQNYADQYRREGAVQQENTAGDFASNTGGYTNSYAQTAGQKTYGQYMDALASKIPELRNQKYQSWQQQQEDTVNKIGVLQGLDDNAYQKYRDKINDDFDFMTYYQNKYATSKGLDMSQFQNELSRWQTNMNAAASNLSDIRNLSNQQYQHNTVSADTNAYNQYIRSKIK